MFETSINQKTVNVKIKRIELCDLLIACTAISTAAKESGETGKKWDDLHEKLKTILDEFDEKNPVYNYWRDAGIITESEYKELRKYNRETYADLPLDW